MPAIRDWTATLWPASFAGTPFFFERDESEGGRRLEVHEFFDSDTPEIEDLGRKPRYYSGTAYLASDTADSDAVALEQILETKGPGTLVVPIMGPVTVRCESFKRTFEKDRMGFVGFTVRFVRDGTAGALTSTALAGQQVFDAADNAAATLAGTFPDALVLGNPADYIIGAAIAEAQNLAAAIDGVRLANPIDADASAAIGAADAAIAAQAPALIAFGNPPSPSAAAILLASSSAIDPTITDPVETLAAVIVANVRALGDGMAAEPDAGAGSLFALAQALPAPAPLPAASPNAAAAAANTAAMTALGRVAALIAWGESLTRATFTARSDAVAARALYAEVIGQELGNWTGAAGAPVFIALQDLQGAVVDLLTSEMADLAPVVTVTAPQSMPALWWAWRLYADPSRAVDLALRNEVTHPSFMPTTFQALAPGYAAANLPTGWPAA
jgi:prophage DNA circulation protein